METASRTSNKQIVAPIRQAWINELRNLLAEVAGSCMHYWAAGSEDREEHEYKRISDLQYKLILMVNPNEEDHKNLLIEVRKMISSLGTGKQKDDEFFISHAKVIQISQQILKKEWNRVKAEI